jgi:hypothetical protein
MERQSLREALGDWSDWDLAGFALWILPGPDATTAGGDVQEQTVRRPRVMRGSEMARTVLIVFSLLTTAALTGCDRREPSSATKPTPAAPASQPQVQWIDPSTVKPGPIRREALSAEQMERVRKLQRVFADVNRSSVDEWVDNFKRDVHPDRELDIWEAMAKAYTAYCSKHTLSPEARMDVYRVVLLRSMASEQDVLERVELKVLTKDQAVEVMRGY